MHVCVCVYIYIYIYIYTYINIHSTLIYYANKNLFWMRLIVINHLTAHTHTHIFVLFLRFVFGLLYGWKIQTWLIIRYLTESVTYWFLYLLLFDRIHDTLCLNKMSRTSSRNIGPQHQKYTSIFHCTHGVLFNPCSPNPSWVFAAKKLIFLVSSDHRSQSQLKFQSCLITEYTGVWFWMS